MSGNTFRWTLAIATLVLGILALTPTFIDRSDGKLDGEIPKELKEGPAKVLLDRVQPLTLGLDLQGGLLLQYNVLVNKAVQDKLDRMVRDVNKRLMSKDEQLKLDITHPEDTNYLSVKFTDAAKSALINDDFMRSFPNLRAARTSDREFHLIMDEAYIEQTKGFAVQQAIETIRQRVDALGVSEPSINRRGESDIIIQMPGLKEDDVERVKKLIGTTALLEFRMVDDAGTNTFFGQYRGQLPKGFKLRRIDGGYLSVTHPNKEAIKEFLAPKLPKDHLLGFEFHPIYLDKERTQVDKERSYWKTYYVTKNVELTGDYITDTRVEIDQQFNTPYVSISFDSEGADLFGKLSQNNVGKRMAIMLDDTVKSAPVFQEAILGGNARISMGSMRGYNEIMADAQDLVIVLRHGALPAPIEKQFETVVGPSLGQDSIDSSVRALLIASLLVVLFMMAYYRISGVISVIAVIANVVLIMAALAGVGATLTLPGIAGVILTVGMAVDANVIIYERIREEIVAGTKAREAVGLGFDRALSAVLDANITTGIAGLVLLQFGTGPIKGFAVTLIIGIFSTLITAIFMTRLLFDAWITGERANKNSLSI